MVYHVGKNGIDEALIKGVGEALKARELIKLSVQESSEFTAREAADALAARLGAQSVQAIGRKFVLYKRNRSIDQYGVK